MIEQELWDAYCTTVVTFVDEQRQGFVITPSLVVVGEWVANRGTDEVLIISAANPYSELMSDEGNLALEVQMKARLDALGFRYQDCHGQSPDGQWVERSVMVFNAPLDVIKHMGANYLQNAIFRWTPETWECISLVSDQHFVGGWTLAPVD
jgi:hypothetical protein